MEYTVLDKIFEGMEEEIYTITSEDKIRLKEIRNTNGYNEILDIIDKIDTQNFEFKNQLVDYIEKYVEDINCENAYFNEKFYKQGFKQGACLLMECFDKKSYSL